MSSGIAKEVITWMAALVSDWHTIVERSWSSTRVVFVQESIVKSVNGLGLSTMLRFLQQPGWDICHSAPHAHGARAQKRAGVEVQVGGLGPEMRVVHGKTFQVNNPRKDRGDCLRVGVAQCHCERAQAPSPAPASSMPEVREAAVSPGGLAGERVRI